MAAVRVADGQRVAIKYLSPRLSGDPRFLEAFRAEAALLRSLDVPSVVRLFDYVEAPGPGAAIVMELVEGVSLHEMIARQGPATPESALLVLQGSLLGLAAAHELGIVHRDYKPENVLVDGTGQSKLTDFGVAVRAGQDAPVGGTPLYMAPEQWNGDAATPASDIYAATAVFFECLTGKTPFSGALGQLAAQHAAAAVPVEMVDEPLRELMARGMAKDPAARPGSAAQFLAELETTAAAAYGADWASRGRSQLAERAAALLLLLLRDGGAAGAGTGSTTALTSLPATRATTRTGRASRRAWLYAGIAAAVIGIAAGSLAAVAVSRSHDNGGPGGQLAVSACATASCQPAPGASRATLEQQALSVIRAARQVPPLQAAGSFCLAGIFKDAREATVSKALNNLDPAGGEALAWEGYTLEGDQVTVRKELASGQVLAGTFDLGQVIYALLAATGEQVTRGTPQEFQWALFGLIGPAAISCAEAAFWLDGTVGGQLGTALQKQFLAWSVGQQLLVSRGSAITGKWVLYRKLEHCSVTRGNGCLLGPMDVTIACTGTTCTIIRTNANSADFQPWDHAIPIAFGQGAWQASGTEKWAAQCSHAPVPGTGVAFTLKVTSGQVLNGVWRAQGLQGTYTGHNVATPCFAAGATIEDVSTTPFQ